LLASEEKMPTSTSVGGYTAEVTEISSIFQQRLRLLMQRRGLIAARLAEKTGIPQSSISRYLDSRNPRMPAAAAMKKIAAALGVEEGVLLGSKPLPAEAPEGAMPESPERYLTPQEARLLAAFRQLSDYQREIMLVRMEERAVAQADFAAERALGQAPSPDEEQEIDRRAEPSFR